MKKTHTAIWLTLLLGGISPIAHAQTPSIPTVPVTIDNYNRAQSDVYFALISKGGGFGKIRHGHDLAPIGQAGIIRPNRDTMYSLAVFDLDSGPVTITLPDPDKHFMTMQVINEDQYTQPVCEMNYTSAELHCSLSRRAQYGRCLANCYFISPRESNVHVSLAPFATASS